MPRNVCQDAVNVNLTDGADRGLTAFLLACCRGNLAMAKLLIEYGADVTYCDTLGRNGYHYLVYPFMEGFTNGFDCQRYSLGQRRQIAGILTEGINARDAEGLTPFVLMLKKSKSKYSWVLTDMFLEKGAETDYVDENGNTLLMMAIQNRHLTAALRLAENGSMVNTANSDGETPMMAAKKLYNDGLCMALKEYGSEEDCDADRMDMANLSRITSNAFAGFSDEDPDNMGIALYLTKKLVSGIDDDDDDDMEYLSNIMYNVLTKDDACCRVLDLIRDAGIGFTVPIHSGGRVYCLRDRCIDGYCGVDVIRKFIEYGVDMDEAVIQGKTPAIIVASRQPRKMMFSSKKDDFFEKTSQFFSKESMEQLDNSGVSAVHEAARNGHLEMMKVMLEKGVDVNITMDEPAESGNTPLHVACIYGHGEIVRLLEENNDGKTPLMLLQYLDLNTTLELVTVFLERGVDVNAVDNYGNTALILNTQNQCYKKVIKELIRAGADVNIADNNGNTALYHALKYGNQEVARFLVKKGADYNHTNNNGETPMQIAVEKGYDTVLELMM